MNEQLYQLCCADGVTGFEGNAAQAAQQMLAPYCDRTEISRSGSLLGWLSCGKPGVKTVLLDAHLDQIGFMVTDVLDGGFLRFTQVGGVDPRMLLGAEVTILSQPPRYGVVSCTPPHLMKPGEENKAVPMDEMLIDTGLLDAKDCIRIGTPIVFRETPCDLLGGQISGKCLDDRAGFFAIVQAVKQLRECERKVDIVICGSTHEETDSFGAITTAFRIRPEYGIAVDVTHADTQDAPSDETFTMGNTVIGVGPNMHCKLTEQIIRTARAYDIPYELEVMEGNTGTNAWDMQVVRDGIAMAVLSIPLKYMHSPIETIQESDIGLTADLIAAFLKEFDGEVRG